MMGMESMRGRGRGGAVHALGAPTEVGVNDLPVEVYGVIYIYIPPDREKLGTGTASQENPSEMAASGGPDAPPTATAAPAEPQNP